MRAFSDLKTCLSFKRVDIPNPSQEVYKGPHRVILKLAFPNGRNPPASTDESFFTTLVALDILSKFLLPEFSIRLRGGGISAAFMAMPETAMNEDCSSVLGENNVRLAWKVLPLSKRIAEAIGMQKSPDEKFRLGVA